jgi:hypothetical protein
MQFPQNWKHKGSWKWLKKVSRMNKAGPSNGPLKGMVTKEPLTETGAKLKNMRCHLFKLAVREREPDNPTTKITSNGQWKNNDKNKEN